jgi:glutamate-1-semialdehyde 2,1-aminomutase
MKWNCAVVNWIWGIESAAKKAGVPIRQTRVGTMRTLFFGETKPLDWNTVKVADKVQFGKFFQKMLENGVYLAPSQFEAGFISTMHDEGVIDTTIAAAEAAFRT